MRATCPECGAQAHLASFFVEEEGKRLAMAVAGMSPELGRATLAYLGLFKPVKSSLRLARAAKLAQEVADLVATGTVCKDERTGVRRAATPQLWATGMETMLAQRAGLTLPLESHGYLRSVVFGLADKLDAAAERQRESNARAGRHLHTGPGASPAPHDESKLERQLTWIAQQLDLGGMTEDEAEAARAAARAKYGEGDG